MDSKYLSVIVCCSVLGTAPDTGHRVQPKETFTSTGSGQGNRGKEAEDKNLPLAVGTSVWGHSGLRSRDSSSETLGMSSEPCNGRGKH